MSHPKDRSASAWRTSRRDFLVRTGGAGVALSSLGGVLAACGNSTGAGPGSGGSSGGGRLLGPGGIPLARRDNPVKLPIYKDNEPIESGLQPENGTLQLYNWVDYTYKKVLKNFEKDFNCKVQLNTFETMDEAVAKLSSGAVQYDIMFPTLDRIAQMVAGKLLQPLNHSYIPNLANVWDSLQSPFYDQGSRYTVPYVTWTTGIAWRNDKLKTLPTDLSNPYDIFWATTEAKGKTSVLDDNRDAFGLVYMRHGITDMNTEEPKNINLAAHDLTQLVNRVNVKVDNNDYLNIPAGSSWLHQAWSGDMVSAPYYMPKGVPVDVVGYWWPPDGKGVIGSDTIAILKGGQNPALAHAFLNYMLDPKNALLNFSWVGYQPPQKTLDPDKLVAQGYVPKNLKTTIVREDQFPNAYELLTLTPNGQRLYQNAWSQFKAGI